MITEVRNVLDKVTGVPSTLSYFETKRFLNYLFERSENEARDSVFRQLELSDYTQGQFHDGMEAHAPVMNLTSEQWLRLFQMYDSVVCRSSFDWRDDFLFLAALDGVSSGLSLVLFSFRFLSESPDVFYFLDQWWAAWSAKIDSECAINFSNAFWVSLKLSIFKSMVRAR